MPTLFFFFFFPSLSLSLYLSLSLSLHLSLSLSLLLCPVTRHGHGRFLGEIQNGYGEVLIYYVLYMIYFMYLCVEDGLIKQNGWWLLLLLSRKRWFIEVVNYM